LLTRTSYQPLIASRSRGSSWRLQLCVAALFVWVGAAGPTAAQSLQGLPRVSPRATVSQDVGITQITIDYHRPAANDREIWGRLVPYDGVWRAGANDNTTIHFSDDVRIEGKTLAAGTYGLHAIPQEESVTLIFSSNSTSWGSFSYDESEDALRVDVTPTESPFEERLSYRFDEVDTTSAVVALYWADRRIPFSIEVDTHELTLAKIRRDLRHLPGFNWQGFNAAANYCLRNDINHEEAIGWADRSIALGERSTNLMTKAGLLQLAGKESEALEIEGRAIEIASEAELNNLGYRYLLQNNDPDRAIELFAENVKRHPDSWNTYDSLADAYDKKGDKKQSIRHYETALSKAPEAQHPRIQAVLDGLRE